MLIIYLLWSNSFKKWIQYKNLIILSGCETIFMFGDAEDLPVLVAVLLLSYDIFRSIDMKWKMLLIVCNNFVE